MSTGKGFIGRSDNKVDAKGRLSIPASARKDLAPDDSDEIVVLYVPTGHLLLFSHDHWSGKIQQKIIERQEQIGGEAVWRAIHRLSEYSHLTTVDAQGRITIPHRLLEKAGIENDAAIIGALDRVSIWNPERYEVWINKGDTDAAIADMNLY